MKMIKHFFSDESGATMVEYAILVALISVVAIGIILIVGNEVRDAFDDVRDCLVTPATCPDTSGG